MKEKAIAKRTLVDEVELLPPLPPLPPRPSTAEHAAAVLRMQITQGRLPPGTRLREEQVAEAFAISRNTVREVFRLLGHERLVDHVANRGVHVRRMTSQDISAIYRTRRLIEPLGVRAAIADAEVRAAMRAAVDRATAAAEQNDWDKVGTADVEFHRALMDGCHSVHLSAMFEQVLAELRLAFLLLPDPERLHGPYLARNRRLLELVEAGDDAAVFAELDDYLTCSELNVLRSIEA